MKGIRAFVLTCICSLLSVSPSVFAQKLPNYDGKKHLGVATCSSSVCHGSVTEISRSHIRRNEYYTWTNFDRHSKSYATLLTPESEKIAKKMGLKNAYEAKVCLDCHADNVPKNMRGEKFLISDGVGCEACHGGSEDWITSHTNEDVTHKENIAKGLFATDTPDSRAKLCLSCHYGTEDKFATHEIMGAGHPRVAFELDTFTELQPPHYTVDEDYIERKYKEASINVWATGLFVSAQTSMQILRGPVFLRSGIIPEFGLYDCHSCHHTMSNLRWGPKPSTKGLKPGDLRLNDCNLIMVRALAATVDQQKANELLERTRALHIAAKTNRADLNRQSLELEKFLKDLQKSILSKGFSRAQKVKIMSNIVDLGLDGEYLDYISAEQAVMAMSLIADSLDKGPVFKRDIDALYNILSNDEKYAASRFRGTLKRIKDTIDAL